MRRGTSALPPFCRLVLPVVALALVAAGCGTSAATTSGSRVASASPVGSPPAGGWVTQFLADDPPPACSATVGDNGDTGIAGLPHFQTIQAAVDGTSSGGVLCVWGDRPDERTVVTRGGDADRPLQIVGQGNPLTAGFAVTADHVVVEGFRITTAGRNPEPFEGSGLYLRGHDLSVSRNTISDTARNGIACDPDPPQCQDSHIVGNAVTGADGQGIEIFGANDIVDANEVARSVAHNSDDADGIRFFGAGHRLTRNYVHDIVIPPSPGVSLDDAPHPDCFQTYDMGGWAVAGVVIEGNVCVDVGHQCLIATAGNASGPTTPPESGELVFRNNVCDNQGGQGVNLQGFHHARIVGNLFLSKIIYYGVQASTGSSDVRVLNNIFVGDYWPYFADETSGSGWQVEGNLAQPVHRTDIPPSWAEPALRWGVDAGLVIHRSGNRPDVELAATSPAIDAGVDVGALAGETDLLGHPRLVDGDGDGVARVDVGPVEYQTSGRPGKPAPIFVEGGQADGQR